MPQTRFLFLILIVSFAFSRPAEAALANVVGNPGFENTLGGSGNWDDTANRGISVVTVGDAPEGNAFLRLDESTTVGAGFVGVFTFQTASPAKEGDTVSFSGLVRANSLDGGDAGQLFLEFQNSAGTISTQTAAVNATSATFQRISASGTAPAGTTKIAFTIRIQPSNAGGGSQVDFDDIVGTINQFPVNLNGTGSAKSVHPGGLTTLSVGVQNVSSAVLSNVELVATPSAGINLLQNQGFLDNRNAEAREGSVIFSLGNLTGGQESLFSFGALVSSGALPGKRYEITLFARSGSQVLSDTFHLVIEVKQDPLFDQGTILGKVFDDRNEDGVQNKGEIGVPHVRLYTEYGVSIVTDKEGRFHIPAVKPGRHLVKIDGHTLPEGTTFVTEESLLIKTTPGLLNKIHFAVRLPESALPEEFLKDLHVWVTQGIDLTQPELRIAMEPDELRVGLGRLEREPTFRIKNNYGEYVSGWRIEIRDELGEKVWTGVGIGAPPPAIPWNGMTDAGEIIRPGTYAYRLIVRDSQDHEDWTPLQFFQVISKADQPEKGESSFQPPPVGSFNLSKDGKRGIPLVAKPTLRIYGKTQPNHRVQIGKIPIDVGPTGEFEQEIFVTPGEKKVLVSATSPDGDTVTVEEKVKVKDSTFFLVALGEEELGVNITRGNLETVARDDNYDQGFYESGKLAYYLKAKVKGKFLVKSRYDTGDKRSELFTHLDPDDYYPIYGDYSQIDYAGQETQERFFILVEMDRSYLKWGSYETEFTDTELGRYNRTLSGLKVHAETLSATRYGDARRGFTLFWANTDTVADHNEFRATGGSLYYLRNRNVVQGSEKVRIEIRDKIQDIPLESRELVADKDYEIDYRQGRILLKERLSSISASETIISNDILDNNPVYLVVDYEFEAFRTFQDKNVGLRGYTHMGDHVRIGGTAVEEKQGNQEHDLRAVDATFRFGRNTKVTTEFAQAKLQQVRQAQSFDGGLSFNNQSLLPSRRPREKAYLIKAESKPLESLDLSGYIQDVEPGFSIDRIKSQEGYRKYGLQARLKISDSFYLLGRQDSTEVAAQIRPLTLLGVTAPFEKIRSTTGQAVFDHGQWNVIGEYLHQHLDIPLTNRQNSLFSEEPFGNAFGLRVAKRVTDWLTPYAKGQMTFSGKHNYQIGGGIEARVGERAKVYFEEMVGSIGDATVLGLNLERDSKTTSYAMIKSRDQGFGERRISTSVGTSHRLSEHSRIYTEREYSTYSGNLPLSLTPTFVGGTAVPGLWSSDIYGYESQFWERWDAGLRFERRHLDAHDFRGLTNLAVNDLARTNSFNTLAASLGYAEPEKLKWASSLELRLEPNAPEVQQWVTQNQVEYWLNRDLSFLGRTNFGNSRFLEPGGLTGRFTELNAGFAYRPVDSDRFSGLLRYTFLDEVASDAQFIGTDSGSLPIDERSHIFALEGGYELTSFFQAVEKIAYRLSSMETSTHPDRVGLDTFLWIHRFNYHVTRKWDVGVEYRMLFQWDAADSLRHGPLVEIDREFYNYVRLGIGYNFTDFNDDLRGTNDFSKNGLFVRLTGKV